MSSESCQLCMTAAVTDLVSLLNECKHAIPRPAWASSIQNRDQPWVGVYCVVTIDIQQSLSSE